MERIQSIHIAQYSILYNGILHRYSTIPDIHE
eukprot:COSAG02_NODE_3356_length_6878_cov_14.421596_6_plen_32_part_00